MKDKKREKEILDELRQLTADIEEDFIRLMVDAPLSIERENLKAGRRSRKAVRRLQGFLAQYLRLSIEKDREYFKKTKRQVEREALGLPLRPDNSKWLINFKGVPKQERKEYARKLREQSLMEETQKKDKYGDAVS